MSVASARLPVQYILAVGLSDGDRDGPVGQPAITDAMFDQLYRTEQAYTFVLHRLKFTKEAFASPRLIVSFPLLIG